MVRTVVTQNVFTVYVSIFREDGTTHSLGTVRDANAMDAFDYALQAQGYFRFAIAEMDAVKIEIEIATREDGCVQLIEITKE